MSLGDNKADISNRKIEAKEVLGFPRCCTCSCLTFPVIKIRSISFHGWKVVGLTLRHRLVEGYVTFWWNIWSCVHTFWQNVCFSYTYIHGQLSYCLVRRSLLASQQSVANLGFLGREFPGSIGRVPKLTTQRALLILRKHCLY